MRSYLALGDSYTIGEQVAIYENFPYQLIQILRKAGQQFYAPEIVAKTGWTTDELATAISETILLPKYDVVTLLIGVNNQYRGREIESFEIEFLQLLETAINFANDISNVIVISIPDWGVTPFAEGKDRSSIAAQIDAYNNVCRKYSVERNVHYIDITSSQRLDGNFPEFLAGDGLHPSGKEYSKWAEAVSKIILSSDQ